MADEFSGRAPEESAQLANEKFLELANRPDPISGVVRRISGNKPASEPRFLENSPGLRLLFRIAMGGVAGAGTGAALGGAAGLDIAKRQDSLFHTPKRLPYMEAGAKTGAVLGTIPGMMAGGLYDVLQERQRTQDLIRAGLVDKQSASGSTGKTITSEGPGTKGFYKFAERLYKANKHPTATVGKPVNYGSDVKSAKPRKSEAINADILDANTSIGIQPFGKKQPR